MCKKRSCVTNFKCVKPNRKARLLFSILQQRKGHSEDSQKPFLLDATKAYSLFWPSHRNLNWSHLGVEFGNEIKVFLQVSGQNGLDDEEAEMLELHVVQVDQEVVLWPGHEEVPGSSSVVVLQHGAVVVQHCLREQHGQRGAEQHLSKSTARDYPVSGHRLICVMSAWHVNIDMKQVCVLPSFSELTSLSGYCPQ